MRGSGLGARGLGLGAWDLGCGTWGLGLGVNGYSSSCHLVILSSCHLVILSPCHLVTLSSCHQTGITIMTHSSVPVLDFGGQTAQLLVRRVRELGVYSELIACDAPEQAVRQLNPRGVILSGGPASVYEPDAP